MAAAARRSAAAKAAAAKPRVLVRTAPGAVEQRSRQLADAFGVTKEDGTERASTFAGSSAACFTPETLAQARAQPAFVQEVEQAFDAFLEGGARRSSMRTMQRAQRGSAPGSWPTDCVASDSHIVC